MLKLLSLIVELPCLSKTCLLEILCFYLSINEVLMVWNATINVQFEVGNSVFINPFTKIERAHQQNEQANSVTRVKGFIAIELLEGMKNL